MVAMILQALPLTLAESEAVVGDGSIAAAMAAHQILWFYCEHGEFRGDDWHEHTHDVPGYDHKVYAIERPVDHIHDCILILPDDDP